ncbi:TetR/AcrR family transcriptional regulator [Mycobacterium sp. AMU20-3851]|uniref:TetR/AcrR family transcriptional regulator n=1 Tax=Mycobacterium sp. AMU20-3851 TaxID=3122055 RepID=UPI003754C56D
MTAAANVNDRIADTALQLLRTGGPSAVTVQAVQAHSGIAKTTIYRRYSDRRDVLRAALSRLMAASPAPPRTQASERLHWVVRQAVAAVGDGIGFGGFASLLTEADPEFNALFREVLGSQRAALVTVIEEMQSDSDVRPDLDPDTLIDALVGAYIAERARTGKSRQDWEARLFAMLWSAVQI